MRVLISGAGIAGSTLAWFLAKAGARITILEKSHSLRATGQNIDITGSAISVIKKMGLLDQVQQHKTPELGTRFIDQRERPFATDLVKDRILGPVSGLKILREDMAMILYEATKTCPNVNYLFGTTITEFLSSNNDFVSTKLSNGGGKRIRSPSRSR